MADQIENASLYGEYHHSTDGTQWMAELNEHMLEAVLVTIPATGIATAAVLIANWEQVVTAFTQTP